MGKFNTTGAVNKTRVAPHNTTNRAGGVAYDINDEQKLASILLTSFAADQFYRSADQTFGEIEALLLKVDPLFAAKAAIFARNEFGMRSISHVTAAELANKVKGQEWTKDFLSAVVRRPDDMSEIMAYFFKKYGTTVPNSMKKGFSKALQKFDAYQLAKYKGSTGIKLVDVVNLCHPRPTEAITALMNGTLKPADTWETKMSGAKEAGVEKADVWKDLLMKAPFECWVEVE